jgi:uncharacterized protein
MDGITAEIKEFVNRVRLGFVATVTADVLPNLSPKGTVIAWDDRHLAFADIHSPGTVQNLLANPAIEINVVDIFTRKGYRFKGRAEVHKGDTVFNDVVAHFREAGSKHPINNIVLVIVEKIIPVWSPAYEAGLSENEITERWIDYWKQIHKKQ